jgi:hypothetical protein
MKKRSLSVPVVIGSILIIFAALALFTSILLPTQVFIVDVVSGLLLGYKDYGDNSASLPDELEAIRVIAKRSDEFQSIITISKSAESGSLVIKDEVLIGFVISSGSTSSKVESITSPFYRTNGVIAGSGIPAEYEGKGAGILEARLPRGSQVFAGDIVLHDEGRRLIMGTVIDIIDAVSDPFLTVRIQNPVNLTTLSEVEILN